VFVDGGDIPGWTAVWRLTFSTRLMTDGLLADVENHCLSEMNCAQGATVAI